jgi:hypothetical protein
MHSGELFLTEVQLTCASPHFAADEARQSNQSRIVDGCRHPFSPQL